VNATIKGSATNSSKSSDPRAPENGLASRVGASVLSQADSGVARPRWARWWVVAAGLTALAFGTIAYGLHRSRVADAPVPEIKSLVVLPLENLSGDPAQEFFAVGMTEELIGSLAQIRALRGRVENVLDESQGKHQVAPYDRARAQRGCSAGRVGPKIGWAREDLRS
jgi:hypothetical protein